MKSLQERNKEINDMRRQHEKEMSEELLKVQCEAEDKGYIYAGNVDFTYSKYWFNLTTVASDGCRIISHFFACETVDDLKKAIIWIVNDTKFYEVTAFVEKCAYVTFRHQSDIDMFFETYYGRA